jgi:hypothetical protein
MGSELSGKVIGVIGLGRIGREVRVQHSPTTTRSTIVVAGREMVSSIWHDSHWLRSSHGPGRCYKGSSTVIL